MSQFKEIKASEIKVGMNIVARDGQVFVVKNVAVGSKKTSFHAKPLVQGMIWIDEVVRHVKNESVMTLAEFAN